MVRVLHVVACLHDGGVERMLYNYYSCFDRSKVRFDFIVHGKEEGMLEERFKALGSNIYHLVRKKDNVLQHIFSLYRIMSNNFYDAVHVHLDDMSFVSLIIAKVCKVKVRIIHSHTTKKDNNYVSYVKRWISCRFSNIYFSCSLEAADALYEKKVIENSNFYIIKNALNISDFQYNLSKRMLLRNKYNLEKNLVIGHIGRLEYPKNQEFLIDVFWEISKIIKGAKLLLVGSGNKQYFLREKCHCLGISEDVLFVGARKNAYDYYQMMDVFVFPSLHEGLGMALIEAQVSGLKCFASSGVPKSSKITNLVEFLSLNDSAREWSKKIIKSLNYNRFYRSNEIAASGYEISIAYRKLQALYIKLCSS